MRLTRLSDQHLVFFFFFFFFFLKRALKS